MISFIVLIYLIKYNFVHQYRENRFYIILYSVTLLCLEIWILYWDNIDPYIIGEKQVAHYSTPPVIFFHYVHNIRDLVIISIIILFKKNQDMIACFSKVDDLALISLF